MIIIIIKCIYISVPACVYITIKLGLGYTFVWTQESKSETWSALVNPRWLLAFTCLKNVYQ